MKLNLLCQACAQAEKPEDVVVTVPYQDQSHYKAECANGHKFECILQQQRCEVLFEIGAQALKDGYPREAVVSFTGSLERLYEYFVKSAWFEAGLSPEELGSAWSAVGNRSERQYGAFVALYCSVTKLAPPCLSVARQSFRNDVVHNGKIPTFDEALHFGQAVLDVARPIIARAHDLFPHGSSKKVWHHIKLASKDVKEGTQVATMWHRTILSITPSDDEKSLQDELQDIKT